MKCAIFIIVSCLGVCLVNSATVTEWGDVSGRIFGYRDVKTPDFKQSFYAFAYPAYASKLPITGIKHLDNQTHPVDVKFLSGGIGEREVTVNIISQPGHGIRSTFVFYTNSK